MSHKTLNFTLVSLLFMNANTIKKMVLFLSGVFYMTLVKDSSNFELRHFFLDMAAKY